jgi:hypothetical protein
MKATGKERRRAWGIRQARAKGVKVNAADLKWLAEYEAKADHRRARAVGAPREVRPYGEFATHDPVSGKLPGLPPKKEPFPYEHADKPLEIVEVTPPFAENPEAFAEVPLVPPTTPANENGADGVATSPANENAGPTPLVEEATPPIVVPDAALDAVGKLAGFLCGLGFDAGLRIASLVEQETGSWPILGLPREELEKGSIREYWKYLGSSSARACAVKYPKIGQFFAAGEKAPEVVALAVIGGSVAALPLELALKKRIASRPPRRPPAADQAPRAPAAPATAFDDIVGAA